MAQAEHSVAHGAPRAQFLRAIPAAGDQARLARSIRAASSKRWDAALRHVFVARYDYDRAGMAAAIAHDEAGELECRVADAEKSLAFARLVTAVDRQMAIPAVTRAALQWKRRHREIDGGRAHWDTAIAVDASRLGSAGEN